MLYRIIKIGWVFIKVSGAEFLIVERDEFVRRMHVLLDKGGLKIEMLAILNQLVTIISEIGAMI